MNILISFLKTDIVECSSFYGSFHLGFGQQKQEWSIGMECFDVWEISCCSAWMDSSIYLLPYCGVVILICINNRKALKILKFLRGRQCLV